MNVFVGLLVVAAQAECHPDATYVENAEYIDGNCVLPLSELNLDRLDVRDSSLEAEPSNSQHPFAWYTCGVGSSATMVHFHNWTNSEYQDETALYWYDEAGALMGRHGEPGRYCCAGQPADLESALLSYGVPVQTCYAPLPLTTEEMDLAGQCVQRASARSMSSDLPHDALPALLQRSVCHGTPSVSRLSRPSWIGASLRSTFAPTAVDRPGACSAVGTSGVASVLGLLGGLVLLWRRR